MRYDLVILTDQRYLKDSKNTYNHNVFYEDFLLKQACISLGMKVTRKAWDDEDFDWRDTRAVVFRSTWDYFDRFQEFLIWLDDISKQTLLFNAESLIRWNLDKHYLADLQKKGIAIADTVFIERYTEGSLSNIITKVGWEKTILKPCISGAGRHTYLIEDPNDTRLDPLFNKLIKEESMMLQKYQHNIATQGEMSLMFFNHTFTHAVLKKAKPGDFRVQDDFGGTVQAYTANQAEIDFAIKALKACPVSPVYARVDIFYDNAQQLALGELELIEPELWFRIKPEAAIVFAKAIELKLSKNYDI
jgi:glutathione synthase/RimK-type ligase-like ATP-grasp enzyme